MASSFQPSGAALCMCAVGICASYLYYGILQEQLFSDAKIGASFLLLTQCISNSLVALVWQRLDRLLMNTTTTKSPISDKSQTRFRQMHHPLLAMTAFCYFVAMAASNESLRYVTYPTAVLAKSSKLIPTMILGSLVERRSYSTQEWLAAACITSGIVLFNLSRNQDSSELRENSVYGIGLLVVSLCMDGMLGASQGLLKQSSDPPPTATETMLYVNLYATAFYLPLSILTNEWNEGWELLLNNRDIQQAILLVNATTAAGQVFIFLTIVWFSPLMCTTITTTRKFFTILLSVLHFGHVFTSVQWLSVALVFIGLYGIIVSKARITTKSEANKKVE